MDTQTPQIAKKNVGRKLPPIERRFLVLKILSQYGVKNLEKMTNQQAVKELKKMLRLPYPPTMTEEEKEFSARLQCHRASTHSVSYLFCRIFETMDEDDEIGREELIDFLQNQVQCSRSSITKLIYRAKKTYSGNPFYFRLAEYRKGGEQMLRVCARILWQEKKGTVRPVEYRNERDWIEY